MSSGGMCSSVLVEQTKSTLASGSPGRPGIRRGEVTNVVNALEFVEVGNLGPGPGASSAKLANRMIDLRATAESLEVVDENFGGPGMREQQRTEEMPPTAKLQCPAGMHLPVVFDVELVQPEIGIGHGQVRGSRRPLHGPMQPGCAR